MKCVEIMDWKMRKSAFTPMIVRVSNEKAEQLAKDGKAVYVSKALWKANGRERG